MSPNPQTASYLFLRFNNLETVLNFGAAAEHYIDAAIVRCIQVNGPLNILRLQISADKDVFDSDGRENFGIFFSTITMDTNFITRHILAHFMQNPTDAYACAACQRDQ